MHIPTNKNDTKDNFIFNYLLLKISNLFNGAALEKSQFLETMARKISITR